jgi:hypothetical protein
VDFAIAPPQGNYQPALKSWLLKFHGQPAQSVESNGRALEAFASVDALRASADDGWATGRDRFGPVTWVRVAAGKGQTITLDMKK